MRARQISLGELAPPGSRLARWLTMVSPPVDRLLGIGAIDDLYQRNKLAALPPFEFSSKSLEVLGVSVSPVRALADAGIPAEGPLLIVCNHPFGAVEALVLADALRGVRSDIRFLANAGLRVFRELRPLLIPTNPLRVTQQNVTSIRRCQAHLEAGGVLILFPAGRVSSHQPDKGRITDGPWNRVVGHLARASNAPILPVYFHGTNSRSFHVLGRLWDGSKLLMLPRELLRQRGRTVRYCAGQPIPPAAWRHMGAVELARYARLMTYAQADVAARGAEAAGEGREAPTTPLAPRGDELVMERELDALPREQRLLEFKQFSVAYARAVQVPALMAEIARERERVFRMHDEGSGQPRDTDAFDQSYEQLLVWDRATRSLVGAYRMGRTDLLLASSGHQGLYLSRMFEFAHEFHDPARPALELGRSFIVPEYQRSFHGLYLLWQGIGQYLVAHPDYRRLYGTVSLSRQYDPRAVMMLCDALIEASPQVRSRFPIADRNCIEWQDFRRETGRLDLATLNAIVRGLDAEGKGMPVLLRHYLKLGAKFHCVGADPNFNNTPGLLLTVDVAELDRKTLLTFLRAGTESYLEHVPAVRQTRHAQNRS
ncbi:MAG: lysophospholipid acyltransferase family protein [Gammaproteobacteria bacterium]